MKFHDRTQWDQNRPSDLWANNCPFCNKNSEYTIWEGKYWYVMHNKYPILWLKTHLMAIPKRHIKMAHDITSLEMWEYPEVEKYIHEFFWENRYFTFMRESLEARSLEHIHYHFLPWQISYYDIENFLKKQWF